MRTLLTRNHFIELACDLGLEIRLDLINLSEFGECPAAVSAEMVHARHPVGVHGGFLLLRVFAPVALDLDHPSAMLFARISSTS